MVIMTRSESMEKYTVLSTHSTQTVDLLNKGSEEVSIATCPADSGNLHQFRSLISHHEHGLSLEPYHAKKTRVMTYKMIYALLGALFISLVFFTYGGIPHALILQHTQNAQWIGMVVTTLSCVLGALCCYFSWTLRVERDVMHDIVRFCKKKLARIYIEKRAEISLKKFLPFSSCYRNTIKLKNAYHKAAEKITFHQEELALILRKISQASLSNLGSREKLFNQALLEFRSKTELVITEFENFNS